MKFIQIADPHVVPDGERLHGLDPRERLEACIADINANHADAELCVVTGDVAHRGEAEAYAVFRECIAKLTVPWRLMIGNHDDREIFKQAFPETACDPNGFVQSSFNTSAGRFILLDTAEPGVHWGSFCEQRAAWLREELDAAGEEPVYLFMHHPPFEVYLPSIDNLRLRETGPLCAVLAGRSSIRHMFLGHVHRPIAGSWKGIPYTALRGTNHQTALDFNAVSPIPKSHEQPAYGIGFLNGETIAFHLHDYMDRSWLPVPKVA